MHRSLALRNFISNFVPYPFSKTKDPFSHEEKTRPKPNARSILRDVCIINDTCVWVVGQIYLRDSTGNIEPRAHNAARWNGIQWEVVKLWFPLWTSTGNSPGLHEGITVLGFSLSDVWFSDGGSYLHWNGTSFEPYYFPPDSEVRGGVKMWGTSSQNLFSVSYNGAICHFDGVSWRRMPSGTTVHLTDIHGTPDRKEVWVCGFTSDDSTALLRLHNGVWQTVWATWQTSSQNLLLPQFRGIVGLCWMSANELRFGSGSVQYYVPFLPQQTYYLENIDYYPDYPHWANYIRGTSKNNMFTSNSISEIHHWNGVNFKKYNVLTDNDKVSSIAVSNNEFFAEGRRYSSYGSRALVLRGRR